MAVEHRLRRRLACAAAALSLLSALPLARAQVAVADLARRVQYDNVKISPDGATLAATAMVNGQGVLALVDVADMHLRAFRSRPGEDIDGLWWVAPDRLVYSEGMRVDGRDRPVGTGELFSVKTDGKSAHIVFGYRAGGENPETHIVLTTADEADGELIAPLRDDPAHALIASYRWRSGHARNAQGAIPEAYRINLDTGKKTQIAISPQRNATFLADHHGFVRFAYGDDDDLVPKVWYRDAHADEWQLVYDGHKQPERFTPLMFDRTDAGVYVLCDGANGVGGLCRWNCQSRKQEILWSAKEPAAIELLPTFDEMDAFAIRTMPGRPAVTLLDRNAPEATLLGALMQQFAGNDVEFTSASRDGKRAVVLVQADTDPGTYYLYDAASGKTRALFQRRPWIKPAQMAPMEPVTVNARDGLPLRGYLTRPLGAAATRGLPMIVLVHGGPYGARDVWAFDAEAQLLASHGYAVMQINFRGSGGSGDAFMHAGYREWGGKMQDDITDATRWAIDQGIADASRICIFGSSYGGYAALEGAVKEPDLYKCAVGHSGIYDLRLMYSRGDIPQSLHGENYLKLVLGEDQSELSARSPIEHVDRLKASVMLIVGGADKRVPPVQGENLHTALAQRKVEHEWLYQRNEGHGYYDEAHVADMYARILAFFDRQIGAHRPAVAK